ncbi:putative sporulation protein, polysaccharide deacetylase family [Luteitalea pratensis]|uniref:Putative sporulation protein, polysaccharide deacetylase family n=1 Tax=Luteitalea pratensis TaxID=1855912 RepID=A0A143PJZ8_LUTPR|nr:polysaccharide deacetylase family protein [Luteitalea pratensis]AMY08746.1 putative sporulation protein, polysaccharide deacetylase family [Luteitalea pratensis]
MRVLSRRSPVNRCLAAALAGAFVLLLMPGRALRAQAPAAADAVAWPGGARMALSLSFDDGRESQVTQGLPVFARHGAKVTLYVVPSAVERHLEGWKQAAAAGHEIGNHSLTHSCSGNFPFSRQKALEEHSIPRMRDELAEANRRIAALLGVTPRTFAYPCGQTFVGRGKDTQSYVPVVAELFLAGRGWLDEAANDPSYVDLAQTLGVEMDGKDFGQIRPLLDEARKSGAWLVLAGHDIGAGGRQTTRVAMLDELFAYVKDPANGIWLATVAEAADVVARRRGRP